MKANRSRVHRAVVRRAVVGAIEGLEDRRMLSAASIEDRVLEIEGTRRADTITIDREGKKSVAVTVNGAKSLFKLKQFGSIRIVLGLGSDFARVGSYERPIAVKAVADAGDGNDTVYTGAGDDSIAGGAGDDSLMSYAGRDTVRGGNGNDQIWGGDDGDTCYGDLGADSIVAGSGDDLAYGCRGDDVLWDGAGTDRVYGNKGDDKYYVNSNRKEFKDRQAAEACNAEVVYSGAPWTGGTGGSIIYNSAGGLGGMNWFTPPDVILSEREITPVSGSTESTGTLTGGITVSGGMLHIVTGSNLEFGGVIATPPAGSGLIANTGSFTSGVMNFVTNLEGPEWNLGGITAGPTTGSGVSTIGGTVSLTGSLSIVVNGSTGTRTWIGGNTLIPADPPPVTPPPVTPPPVEPPPAGRGVDWRPPGAPFGDAPAPNGAGMETVGVGDDGTDDEAPTDGALSDAPGDPPGANGPVTEGDGGSLFL